MVLSGNSDKLFKKKCGLVNMDKGKNNLGGKPKETKKSFFKKMAKKVFGLIPQRALISRFFKSSGSDGKLFNDNDHQDDQNIDETMLQSPTKRQQIRMFVTHPSETFAIQSSEHSARSREDVEDNDEYHDSLDAPAEPSTSVPFVASASAIRTEMRNSSSSAAQNSSTPRRPILIPHRKNNGAAICEDGNSESTESISGSSTLFPQQIRRQNSLERKTSLEKKAEAFGHFPISRVGHRHFTMELARPIVPDELKLRRRQRLLESTLAARKIISANSGPPPSSPFSQNGNPAAESQEYHLRTVNDNQKFVRKLQTKSKITCDIEQPPEVINSPNIILPIPSLPSSNISLRKRSNSLPSISMTSKTSNVEYSPMKNPKIDSKSLANVLNGSKETSYKFPSPVRLQNNEKRKLKSIDNYTLSKSIDEESRDNSSKSPKMSSNFVCSALSTAPNPKKRKRENEQTEEDFWECSECFIENYRHKENCVVCNISKHKKFKMTPTKIFKWECKGCLMKNSGSFVFCFFCMTPKREKTYKKRMYQRYHHEKYYFSPNRSALF